MLALGLAVAQREMFAAGGGGPDGNPPWQGPASQPSSSPAVAPELGASGGSTISVRIHTAQWSRDANHLRLVVRHRQRAAFYVLPAHETVVLPIPTGPGVRIDVLGTDALDIPVSGGQFVRIVLP